MKQVLRQRLGSWNCWGRFLPSYNLKSISLSLLPCCSSLLRHYLLMWGGILKLSFFSIVLFLKCLVLYSNFFKSDFKLIHNVSVAFWPCMALFLTIFLKICEIRTLGCVLLYETIFIYILLKKCICVCSWRFFFFPHFNHQLSQLPIFHQIH